MIATLLRERKSRNSSIPAPRRIVFSIALLLRDGTVCLCLLLINRPAVALAFKLEDGRYGQLTYVRVYQGCLTKDSVITNTRSGKQTKVGRLVRLHSDEMEDIDSTGPGDIVAIFGLDCHSGDTFTSSKLNVTMTSIHVPTPVISLSVKPVDNRSQVNLTKALQRFTKGDPTFKAGSDEESGDTINSTTTSRSSARALSQPGSASRVSLLAPTLNWNTVKEGASTVEEPTAGKYGNS